MKYCYIFFFVIIHSIRINAQVKIKFELQDIPKHKDLTSMYFIAGSFNNWNPSDTLFRLLKVADGKYTLSKQFPAGQYEYKITRGNWSKVEAGLKGSNRPNRILNLKNDTSIVVKVLNWTDEVKNEVKTVSRNVKLLDSAFLIPQLNTKRRIWIYLPPSYASSNKKYPVLYMNDGQNLFDESTSGFGEWGVDELLDSVIAKGAPECIVVGIDHGRAERLMEYNPYDSKYGKGKGKLYVDFLANQLKPFIDQHYRTKTEAKYTSIAGSSMGGLISMYAIITYPDVYGKAGVFSPSFWIAKKIEDDIKVAIPNLKMNRIYFVAGALEGDTMIRDMNSVYQILNPDGKNKNIKFVEKADGEHKEWFWHREFSDFYRFISK